jgi:hypothetical protein
MGSVTRLASNSPSMINQNQLHAEIKLELINLEQCSNNLSKFQKSSARNSLQKIMVNLERFASSKKMARKLKDGCIQMAIVIHH